MKIHIIVLLTVPICAHLDPAHLSAVSKVIKRYKRLITVLEIGKSCEYIPQLAEKEIIGIALIVGDTCSGGTCLPKNTTVLAPQELTLGQLTMFAQCEHIDVVIVHDSTLLIKGPLASLVGTLINLGEHIFIEAETSTLEEVLLQSALMNKVVEEGTPLFYSYKPKKYLTYTRFTQKRPSQTQYKVESTYKTKQFIKEEANPLPWVHGINLVTFVMLNGIFPTNDRIKQQFLSFRTTHPQHTDLVLGNIIVQGDNLIPIDLTDARRRAPLSWCITAAVRAFDKSREDPRKWINEYYKMLFKS